MKTEIKILSWILVLLICLSCFSVTGSHSAGLEFTGASVLGLQVCTGILGSVSCLSVTEWSLLPPGSQFHHVCAALA